MSSHHERLGIAIAMRTAIINEIMRHASPEQSDRYRHQGNNWHHQAITMANNVDPLDVLAKNGRLTQRLNDREKFERAARAEKFPTEKRDDGSYVHHITNRIWRMWLAARQE